MENIINDFLNAFKKSNNGLMQLIFINVAVFVVLNILKVLVFITGIDAVYALPSSLMFIPAYWKDFIYQPWSLFTYFFSHISFWHIVSNMIGLYWFGRIVDDLVGSGRLVGVFVWGGLVGGLVYLMAYNLMPQFIDKAPYSTMLGASGGVLAVVVAAATLAPDYRFNLVFIGPVKIIWIAAVYVFISFVNTTGTNAGGNIAHLGGALMGWIFITQLRKGVGFSKPVTYAIDFSKALFSSSSNLKVSHRKSSKNTASASKSSSTSNDSSNVPQHEIDAILDKISASGYESLSKDEKRKLFSASQKNQS